MSVIFGVLSGDRRQAANFMALSGLVLTMALASRSLGREAVESLDKGSPATPARSAELDATNLATEPTPASEQTLEFARRFAAAAKTGDTELNALINWDALLDRAARGTELDEASLANFKRDFKSTTPVAKEICEALKNDGSYHFLHATRQSRSEYLLFRMLSDAGLNYHALLLDRDKAGNLEAVDMGVFVSGELLSQTLRRAMLQSQANAPAGGGGGRANKVSRDLDQIKKITEMESAQRRQKPQEALRIYRQLPQQMQHDKYVLRLRCQFTKTLSESEYAAAMEDFREAYPHDSGLLMDSVDYFFLKQRYPEAHQTITELNKLVEGDPYLEVLRASLLVLEDKLDEARQCVRRAIAAEPDLLPAHWAAVTIALKQKDYRTTRRLLTNIETNLGVRLTDLRGLEEYAGFVASPEHASWLAERKAPPVEATNPPGSAGE